MTADCATEAHLGDLERKKRKEQHTSIYDGLATGLQEL